MQSYCPERFERDMGTSEGEWLTALPCALGEHAYELGTGKYACTLVMAICCCNGASCPLA